MTSRQFLFASLAGAAFLLLSACGGAKETGSAAPALRAAVTFVKGQAHVERDGKRSPLSTDMVLNQADIILTGKSSSADLLIQGLGAVKLGENTRVRLLNLTTGIGNRAEVAVDQGQMASFVQKRRKDDRFHVITPTAIAGVRGTVFLTTVTPAAGKRKTRVKVSVFSGSVGLRIPGQDEEIVLDRNSQLEIEGMQKLSRNLVRTLSPEALKEMKRLTVNHKSNSLEFNTLVQELESSNQALNSVTVGGNTTKELNVRRRQMDRDRMATDTVAKARQTQDSSVLKREVNTDHLKLKPKAGYRE